MAAVHGARAQIGMAASAPADELYELVGGDLTLTEDLFEASGLIGSRDHRSERVRQNTRRVSGSLTFNPNAAEIAALTPRIMGAAASGTSFTLSETLPSWVCVIDYVQRVATYSGMVANRGTYRATQGGPLELQIDAEGTDVSIGAAGTFPALTLNVATGPFICSDAVVSVSGTNYYFREFEVTIDNTLDTERFFNNQTRVSLPPTDRIVTWRLSSPYGDSSALYGLASLGVAVIATFTNGTVSIALNSQAVAFPRQTPTLSGRDEIMIPLLGIARRVGSTASITMTIDSTV